MIHESHKYKLQKILSNSPLMHVQSSRTVVLVSFDAKSLILFNKTLSYFEVYSVDDRAFENDLIGADLGETVDFYTPLVLVHSGICQNIVWHQYTSQ